MYHRVAVAERAPSAETTPAPVKIAAENLDFCYGPKRALEGISRALAVEPEILLMDEPSSALDPIATQRIADRRPRHRPVNADAPPAVQ